MDVVSYILAKRYVDDSLSGAGALVGKSAYEIAVQNGFIGSETDWLLSLQGSTPEIGPNGTWIIDGLDTGIIASPDLTSYATQAYVQELFDSIEIPESSISMIALTIEEILEICK